MFSSTQILLNEGLTDSMSAASPLDNNNKTLVKGTGRWTKEEHQKFVEAVKKFGKNWKQVEEYVGTRTGAQVRSHAQKFFNKLEREQSLQYDGSQVQLSPQIKESLRKMSETSISTNPSVNNEGLDEIRMEEIPPLSTNLVPINMKPFTQQQLLGSPVNMGSMFQDTHSVPSGSPKLTPFAETTTFRRNPRKMSEDVIVKPSVSMFEVILSKIRTLNNGVNFPRLSDLVDMDMHSNNLNLGNYRSNMLNQSNGFTLRRNSNVSFRTNSRKFSEDNILISAPMESFRKSSCMDMTEFELLAKKMKKN